MLRHGVELWLKCLIGNHQLDRWLLLVTESRGTFDELCDSLSMSNAKRKAFKTALCVMRNVLVDGLTHPDCWNKRQDKRSANQALEYLRGHPKTPRSRIGQFYIPIVDGHDLENLWRQAEPYVVDLYKPAKWEAQRTDGCPMKPEEYQELCILLHHWDPQGDALRYPFSMKGAWHSHRLRLNLDSIESLADRLSDSTLAYQSWRECVYTMTTVSDPQGDLYFRLQ